MSITYALYPALQLLHTVGEGVVDDEQLLDYYRQALEDERFSGVTRELVDGRGITEMRITADGQHRLVGLLQGYAETLKGLAVALAAPQDVVFGMFRMWELRADELSLRARAFRGQEEAQEWLGIPRTEFIP